MQTELFALKVGFSFMGLIVFLLPMLINIAYLLTLPPQRKAQKKEKIHPVLEMGEQVFRILYLFAICFLVSENPILFHSPYFYLGVLFLFLYYVVWIKYFIKGKDEAVLGESFLFVPIPLAVFPVLYLIFASLLLHNLVALCCVVLFGVCHFLVSDSNLAK